VCSFCGSSVGSPYTSEEDEKNILFTLNFSINKNIFNSFQIVQHFNRDAAVCAEHLQ